MKRALTLAFIVTATSGLALDVGESDFAFSSELVAEGYAPFATSGVGNAIYGLSNGACMYLCFIADSGEDQAERQRVLLAELAGKTPDRTVPNIPVACIKTQ